MDRGKGEGRWRQACGWGRAWRLSELPLLACIFSGKRKIRLHICEEVKKPMYPAGTLCCYKEVLLSTQISGQRH